jgi:ABC-2 type transport system ATP-binding protein
MSAIEVKDLAKRYKKAEQNAVDSISFNVNEGEFFAFLGPNCAGKTTTISILTTTLSKSSGTVMIGGMDIDEDAARVREQVGIIFQKPSIDLNLTAEENIRFHAILYGLYPFAPTFRMMPKEYKDRVIELADVIGLKDDLGKPVKSFSGGMKRKLEIIRSLMHNPKILFLDEPTLGLDPDSRENLWEYLQQVRKNLGMTVFLTTHYLEEVESADRVCIINKGKIVANGTPSEIKKKIAREYVLLYSDRLPELRQMLDSGQFEIETQADSLKVYTREYADLRNIIIKGDAFIKDMDIHKPSLEDAYLRIIREDIDI